MKKNIFKYLVISIIFLTFSYVLAKIFANQISKQEVEKIREKLPNFFNFGYKELDFNLFSRSLVIKDVNCILFSNDTLKVPIKRIEIDKIDFENQPPTFLEASITNIKISPILLNLLTLGKGIYFKKEIPLYLKIKYTYLSQKKCLVLREIEIKSKNKTKLLLTGTFCNISVKGNNFYSILFTYPQVKVKIFTLDFVINDIQFLNDIMYLDNLRSKREGILHFLDDKISMAKNKRALTNLKEIKKFFLRPNKIIIKETPGASITLGKLLNPEDLEQTLRFFTVKAFPPKSPSNLTIN